MQIYGKRRRQKKKLIRLAWPKSYPPAPCIKSRLWIFNDQYFKHINTNYQTKLMCFIQEDNLKPTTQYYISKSATTRNFMIWYNIIKVVPLLTIHVVIFGCINCLIRRKGEGYICKGSFFCNDEIMLVVDLSHLIEKSFRFKLRLRDESHRIFIKLWRRCCTRRWCLSLQNLLTHILFWGFCFCWDKKRGAARQQSGGSMYFGYSEVDELMI